MRNKIMMAAASAVMGMSLIGSPGKSEAADTSVPVTLPKFTVNFNGSEVKSEYRQYPLLVYKDITYVPITWYDSRLLGLETGWSTQKGLSIGKGSVTSSYAPYASDTRNRQTARATVPTFPVTINGKTVDNSREEYPLLLFNNITYFPLTWRFAHDEFGWGYRWDAAAGLSITSDNPQVKALNLPASAGDQEVAFFKGDYYYSELVGKEYHIYRAPGADLKAKKLVYAYEADTGYGINKSLTIRVKEDELHFSYHSGGAIMGSDVYGKVGPDGKGVILQQGYLDFREIPLGTLFISQHVPPQTGNMYLLPKGEKNPYDHPAGDPKFYYGWQISMDGEARSFSGSSSSTVIGDHVYVIATPSEVQEDRLNRIYRVNLKTNKTELLVNSEVIGFKIIKDQLYYVKTADRLLYSSNLDGSGEQKISHNEVAAFTFGVMDGKVYYTSAGPNDTLKLYKAASSGKDELVMGDAIVSVQFLNDRILCKLAAGGDYGLKILDRAGALRLAVADQVAGAWAYGDTLLFISAAGQGVKEIKIP
ncbi:DUF5050 domain-containing protein [Paenibacillus sp. S-38]|uniref:DUF5050 domain-containing protein n=1 Tax=Paenibacillus sp. S-38 TaxID=3416710 RepID=UPI003CF6C7BF